MNDGDITESAAQAGCIKPRAETLCLAWVHPEPRLTPLDASRPESAPLSLGRGHDCDVQLPGAQCSRRHAEIVRRGKRRFIVDQSSKNGCFLNGQRVDEAPLAEQDVLRVGEWLAVVTFVPNAELETALLVREERPGLVAGPALRAALRRVEAVAKSNLNVIVVGETGTGKEFIARALHELSGRGRLVPVNCASIPEQLADAYLFGYKKGAFTGATADQLGFFQSASGGTLFLDELDDLPLAIQPKLLRALQQGQVAPLGRIETQDVDVRVVCATQQRPERSVDAGTLRADLFARLNGVQIGLPPLRARREEVLAIFLHALAASGGPLPSLDPDLAESLLLHDWPLNAREVVQLARRLRVEHGSERTLHRDLWRAPAPARPRAAPSDGDPPGAEPGPDAPSDERLLHQLLAALRDTSGNVSLAAKKLHISRQRAYRLIAGRSDVWALRHD